MSLPGILGAAWRNNIIWLVWMEQDGWEWGAAFLSKHSWLESLCWVVTLQSSSIVCGLRWEHTHDWNKFPRQGPNAPQIWDSRSVCIRRETERYKRLLSQGPLSLRRVKHLSVSRIFSLSSFASRGGCHSPLSPRELKGISLKTLNAKTSASPHYFTPHTEKWKHTFPLWLEPLMQPIRLPMALQSESDTQN